MCRRLARLILTLTKDSALFDRLAIPWQVAWSRDVVGQMRAREPSEARLCQSICSADQDRLPWYLVVVGSVGSWVLGGRYLAMAALFEWVGE